MGAESPPSSPHGLSTPQVLLLLKARGSSAAGAGAAAPAPRPPPHHQPLQPRPPRPAAPRPRSAPRPTQAGVAPLLARPLALPQHPLSERRPWVERLQANSDRPTGLHGEDLTAERLLCRAEGVLQSGGDWRDAVDCFADAAARFAADGRRADAAAAEVRAADCHTALKEPGLAAAALSRAAALYRDAGEAEDSTAALAGTVALYEELGMHARAATQSRALSEAYLDLGDAPRARERAQAACRHFLQCGQYTQAGKQARQSAELAVRAGLYAEAAAEYDSLTGSPPPSAGALLSPRRLRAAARCPDADREECHLAALLSRMVTIAGAAGDPQLGVARVAECDAVAARLRAYEQHTPGWSRGSPYYDVAAALIDATAHPEHPLAPRRATEARDAFLDAVAVVAWPRREPTAEVRRLVSAVAGRVAVAQGRSAQAAAQLRPLRTALR